MAVRSGSHLDFYILCVHHRFPTVTLDPMEITIRIPHAPLRERDFLTPIPFKIICQLQFPTFWCVCGCLSSKRLTNITHPHEKRRRREKKTSWTGSKHNTIKEAAGTRKIPERSRGYRPRFLSKNEYCLR